MITLMLRFRVEDYDEWRPQYDAVMERDSGVVRSYRVWRGLDDRNVVIIAEEYESRDAAESLLSDPKIQEEIKSHGVDMSSVQIDYLDQV